MGLNPFSDYDPYERLDDLAATVARQALVIQKLSEQTANARWMITQINLHLAGLTDALNHLAELTGRHQQKLNQIEEQDD